MAISVLVVEDDRNIAELLQMYLEKEGYAVTIETSGRSLFKTRNIIIGSLEDAKILLTAHYDTCAMCPFPNVMAPTNPLIFIFSQTLVVFLVYFIMQTIDV